MWVGKYFLLDEIEAVEAAGDAEDLGGFGGCKDGGDRIRRRIQFPAHPISLRAGSEATESTFLAKGPRRKGGEHRPDFSGGCGWVGLQESPGFGSQIQGPVVGAGRTVGAKDHGDPMRAQIFPRERWAPKPSVTGGAVNYVTPAGFKNLQVFLTQKVAVSHQRTLGPSPGTVRKGAGYPGIG